MTRLPHERREGFGPEWAVSAGRIVTRDVERPNRTLQGYRGGATFSRRQIGLSIAAAEQDAAKGWGIVERLDVNKQLVRTHFQALNEGNYQLLDKIHHPLGRNHAPGAFDLSEWPEEGVSFGPRDVQATFEWLRSGFSNLRVDILDLLAEGDKVVARVEMSGIHDGEFVGLEPTGRSWKYQHVHIFRVEEGLIVEHWAVRDDLKAMIQLGVIASPAPT